MTLPPLAPLLADQLMQIPGVLGVVLGGSHATGTATPDSDLDLSLAYDTDFDLAALDSLCKRLDDDHAAERRRPAPSAAGGRGWTAARG